VSERALHPNRHITGHSATVTQAITCTDNETYHLKHQTNQHRKPKLQ